MAGIMWHHPAGCAELGWQGSRAAPATSLGPGGTCLDSNAGPRPCRVCAGCLKVIPETSEHTVPIFLDEEQTGARPGFFFLQGLWGLTLLLGAHDSCSSPS